MKIRAMAIAAMVALASVSSLDPAWGKPATEQDDGGNKKKSDTAIKDTGIDLFDDVFRKVGPIDRTLSSVEGSLRSAKLNLIGALALEKGTPLKDAVAELENRAGNKISLVKKGSVPTLSVSDGVPSNVKSAVDAVNGLTKDLTSSMDDLKALPAQIDALVNQTKKFPNQLKAEFQKGNDSILALLFQLPKASSALKHNLGIVSDLPGRTTRVTDRSTEILGVVTTTFR
jgi:hypothetical protein